VLYVEGARDREILRGWSDRLLPWLAARIFGDAVILGGRRPARAIEHFRGLGGGASGVRGLCVLDRDDGRTVFVPNDEEGLEFFTWSRRHIESYLLVPAAIRRALRLDRDARTRRVLASHLPAPGDEARLREVDAKRLLAPNGAVSRALSRRIPLASVARATRKDELHPDVHVLFARLRDALAPTPSSSDRA
jgi:hypothetical protein